MALHSESIPTLSLSHCPSTFQSALLKEHSAADPIYLGRLYSAEGTHFYSGGSGTILSREALRRFTEAVKTKSDDVVAPYDTFADDLELGKKADWHFFVT
jgi:hypothetical protein